MYDQFLVWNKYFKYEAEITWISSLKRNLLKLERETGCFWNWFPGCLPEIQRPAHWARLWHHSGCFCSWNAGNLGSGKRPPIISHWNRSEVRYPVQETLLSWRHFWQLRGVGGTSSKVSPPSHTFMVCLWICAGSVLRHFLPNVLRFLPTRCNSAKHYVFSREKRRLDCGALQDGAHSWVASKCGTHRGIRAVHGTPC